MSKFILIGDPHITHKSLDKAETLFSIVEDLNMDAIWLGDFLDTKEVIRGKCLNLLFERLKQSKLHHYIIIGNHDWFNLECHDHALQVLKVLPNVTIVDKPTVIPGITLLPYSHSPDEIRGWLNNIPEDNIVIGHFDISGFDYGNGFICESGLQEQEFSKFRMTISGHFHAYQAGDYVTYLGTPFSHSFGESNQSKYIGILSIEDHVGLELIPTPFQSHKTISINCNNEDVKSKLKDVNINDLNRFILTGSLENIQLAKSHIDIPGSKIVEKPDTELNSNIVLDENSDNLSKFKTWATDIKKLNKSTIKVGLSILEGLK